MDKKLKVIAFSGSLRKESYTTKLVKAFKASAPSHIEVEFVSIADLPFINQDLEDDLPKSVTDLHNKVKSCDAVLFATPEYNRSYSPVLKNAIDWGSRPQGTNTWNGKPAGVVGCSPYQMGGFGAVNHLRQVLLYVNTATMQQPEFYLNGAADVFDDNGNLSDKETQEHVDNFWKEFSKWIHTIINN